MLTVDFDRLSVRPGDRVLDLGCGEGRHSVEALRRGAVAVAVDLHAEPVRGAHRAAAEAAVLLQGPLAGGSPRGVQADALHLPFPDGAFDVVIASEVLEHIPDDAAAMREITRVVRPGGRVGVTVPAWFPERVCWTLSDGYHSVEGGHVRIYRAAELERRLAAAGLRPTGRGHAHALHSPYWWLRCALGVEADRAPVRAYHRLLVWDLMRRPRLTRLAERALNPVLGKSLVVYCTRPAVALNQQVCGDEVHGRAA